ncbi:MAG: outer membrane protein assembly factor BamD [Flavobacterium sp. MedPE-SWcel]|uniref:outer membrane protein assembly factor BamD n=1 Tax=uncultured Flavobacterium sp. TaxID=165435 RepID=UPI00090ED951|nr:outer membrane protein assembly factor BamD [uncultured Flavobacterium sp.]OIQ22414.1 MAG: outer membrane protein assembly factor BamD [Flavobacterium sp. MedPE-SWcel]
MAKYLYIILLAITVSSCSEYQKALKADDLKLKYEVAVKMYESEKYSKAIRLIEQVAPSYRGRPQGAKLFYVYSMSLYKTKSYYPAGYQFESFAANYPRSEKVEEASFMGAKSYYQLSPKYSLDQVDTYKALDKLQTFINNYPNSQFMPEANQLVKELNEKLEKKAFEIAKQYSITADYFGDFKAAIVSLDNFLLDHPGTIYKEDALFYKLDAYYRLSINSVESKKKERLETAKTYYDALLKFKADTKYMDEATTMIERINTELELFSK